MDVSSISIGEIGLSVRSYNALRRAGIETVGQLLEYNEESLLQIRNLGRKSIDEILLKMEEYTQLSNQAAQDEPKDELELWLSDENNRNAVVEYLREKNIRPEYLSGLSLESYNKLLFAGIEYLHEIVLMNEEQLMMIPGMDPFSASEIAKTLNSFIRIHLEDIKSHCHNNQEPESEPISEADLPPVMDMIQRPEYHSFILTAVKKNDHSLQSLDLPPRAKNQLLRAGFRTISDIVLLSREQFMAVKNLGAGTIDKIIDWKEGYLKGIESELRRTAAGDISSVYSDDVLRTEILSLYQGEKTFGGFSLKEMEEALALPQEIPEERLKKIIGKLLAEKELEYVDFRCYRLYPHFTVHLNGFREIDDRSKDMVLMRIQGQTLEMIAQKYGLQRERVRQIIAKAVVKLKNELDRDKSIKFDEDYYRYFYQNYAFNKKDASEWLGISEATIGYFELFDIKQGNKALEAALEDTSGLETSLRLKIKTYLNRNKIFMDGMWVEKKRSKMEDVVLKKFCRDEVTFEEFSRFYNRFLEDMEIPYDEDLYYTDAIIRSRTNRLADSRNVLWKQNERLRYYDINGRDYTELLDTLHLDSYKNIELSTLKFINDYPEMMKQYDIRDQYELHNLLKKITPEGSYHNLKFKRMPQIIFGQADRDAAVFDLMAENAPISAKELEELARSEYGYDYAVFTAASQKFTEYYHNGMYSIDHKHMSKERLAALHKALPDEFYYIEEIKKIYSKLFTDGDITEVNPYNLKRMGFVVLSKYVLQHYESLYQYFSHLLLEPDMVDVTGYRSRFTYVQMFSQCVIENQRSLQIIEYEPNKFINFRVLEREGITSEMIRDFCGEINDSVEDGCYFTVQSLDSDGLLPQYDLLSELGFSEWFYSNLLLSDSRFSHQKFFGNIVFFKGDSEITIKSFILDLIHHSGSVDIMDLISDLKKRFGCVVNDKSDIIRRVQDTEVYYDDILERFYASKDMYYDELEREGW